MTVRLEIRRSIAPTNKWHWAVAFDNGHLWEVSEGYNSIFTASLSALVFGIQSFKLAEKRYKEWNK